MKPGTKIRLLLKVPTANSKSLTPGSEHVTVEIPAEHKDMHPESTWILNDVGEPVKVLWHEYELVDNQE